jgi:hypothetical protein
MRFARKELALTEGQRRALAPIWSLMALGWWALTINWIGGDAWLHGVVTFLVGFACWMFSEWLRRSE